MKVKELIAQLKKYDQEAEVTYMAALKPTDNIIKHDVRHIYLVGDTKRAEIIISA